MTSLTLGEKIFTGILFLTFLFAIIVMGLSGYSALKDLSVCENQGFDSTEKIYKNKIICSNYSIDSSGNYFIKKYKEFPK